MDRMKTFLIYALLVIGFIFYSNFLIHVGLNSSFRKIERKDNLSQVRIEQAEATLVNGRMKGTISNASENPLGANYVKIDFYSPRDLNLGTKYIDISDIKDNDTKDFELYFKLEDVKYYQVSFTNEKQEQEISLLPKDMTGSEILVLTIFTMLIFW